MIVTSLEILSPSPSYFPVFFVLSPFPVSFLPSLPYPSLFLLPVSTPFSREEGIPEMLDVDDMVKVKIPDSRSIMTFLVTIYQHFNS